jgi:hypothetical protein
LVSFPKFETVFGVSNACSVFMSKLTFFEKKKSQNFSNYKKRSVFFFLQNLYLYLMSILRLQNQNPELIGGLHFPNCSIVGSRVGGALPGLFWFNLQYGKPS